jgi:hypothetical protein
MKLWQLKKLSTNETLNEPQKLPENWGPIFGLAGFEDRLGDLSWLGEDYADQAWVIVGDAPAGPAQSTEDDLAWEKAKELLRDSDWSMLSDVPMSSSNKVLWIEYRRSLRDIRLHPDFPNMAWPVRPE